jgi:hypothetical protein
MPIGFMDEHTIMPFQFENVEWLTIGQIIDDLKVGEIAESDNKELYITTGALGTLLIASNLGDARIGAAKTFQLTPVTKKLKWRILPKYVTRKEALHALVDGKTIIQSFPESRTQWKYHFDGEYINTWVSQDGTIWTNWTDCNGKGAITNLNGLWQISEG